MARIYQSGPDPQQWIIETEDGRTFGGIVPPEDGEVLAIYESLLDAGVKPVPFVAPVQSAPDSPTLSDWRVGLLLWGRRDELLGKVEAEKAKGTPIGAIADERVNYANNVLRAQLLQLRAVFGFSEAEIDESLWRADRVAKGDLSGVWPLPAAA